MNETFISKSEEQTKTIASQFVPFLKPGSLLTLSGNLGSGKTIFVKGIATGLGIKRPITSPTFTIIKEYEAAIPLYHMDAYRLEHSEEDIGFDEYIYGNGITIIEWACFIEEYIPENRLEFDIAQVDDTTRSITVHARGTYYEQILLQFLSTKGKTK